MPRTMSLGPRDSGTPTYLDGEYRMLFRNLTDPERNSGMDVDGWVKYARAIGATTVFLDIKTHYGANWHTNLIPRDPAVGDRDVGAELARAAKKVGLKFCFYIQLPTVDSMATDHADWQSRKADGSLEAAAWGCSVFCLNSGYRELLGAMLREIITLYHPQGFFFDGYLPGFSACYCEACKQKYRQATGRELPSKPAWEDPAWYEYLRWRNADHANTAQYIHEVIHGLDPKIAIAWNSGQVWFGWYGAQSPAKCQWLDFACAEDALGVMKNPIRLNQFPAFTHGDMLAWSIGVTRSYQNGRRANHYNHFQPSTRLPEAICSTNLVIAAGAQVCIQEGFRHMKPVFDRVREVEPFLDGALPAGDVALHYSERAHNTYYRPNGLADDMAFYHETGGLFKGLMDAHALTEFVTDEWLEQGELDRFRLVVLPNSASLSERATRRLRQYVRKGGSLLVGFEANLRDENGCRKTDKLLWPGSGLTFVDAIETLAPQKQSWENVVPLQRDRPLVPDQFLRFEGYKEEKAWLGEDLRLGERPDGVQRTCALQFAEFASCHFPAKAIEIRASRSWTELFRLRFRRNRTDGWEECPAAVTRQVGKGRITYVNFQLGTLLATRYHAWWRQLMGRLLQVAARRSPIDIMAPGSVKAFFWKQPREDRHILHLVNDLSSAGLREFQREDCIPVPVEVTVRLPGLKQVQAVVGAKGCRIHREGRTWRIKHSGVSERLILVCEKESQ